MYPISKGEEVNIAVIKDENPWLGEQHDGASFKRRNAMGPYSIIQIPRSTATAVFVSSGIQRMPRVLVRQRALDKDALILSRLLGLVTSPDQLSCLPSVQFHPPATGPGCGYRNLQTSPTKGCPLIWFYDLGADVQGAEDRFKELTTKD
ncbi:uncharacterized protein PADG_06412 [Paracoccidioides brasiliensis Pb18]|uniref:Uncharacterized protein n=1 Tax=Paracoccidioides brasiliensis (strain Pb18) TaxID=502780 RepID=C1GGH5_PARBD|nr:uncharacterized protein PADG_06412 [Paracoccidioides brasiliensis Pb18]EEH50333.2 hypothetical protein PADG_06412 [Paracoccidioides brasiliensis Pb18]